MASYALDPVYVDVEQITDYASAASVLSQMINVFSFTFRQTSALLEYLFLLQQKVYLVLMSVNDEAKETTLCDLLMRLLSFAFDSVFDDVDLVAPDVLRFIERKMNTTVLIMRKSAQGFRTRRLSPLLFESLTYFCLRFHRQTQRLLQISIQYLLDVFQNQSSARYKKYFTKLSIYNLLQLQTDGSPEYAALLVQLLQFYRAKGLLPIMTR